MWIAICSYWEKGDSTQKRSFSFRISSINVTKSAGIWSHLLKNSLMENILARFSSARYMLFFLYHWMILFTVLQLNVQRLIRLKLWSNFIAWAVRSKELNRKFQDKSNVFIIDIAKNLVKKRNHSYIKTTKLHQQITNHLGL